jgi:hypothetical protein
VSSAGATAGYSGTPLPAKLGVRPDSRVLLDSAPAGLGVRGHTRAGAAPYDVVLLFAPDRARLVRRWPRLAPRLTTAGRLWVCWPKRSSGLQTDLSETDVRAYGLAQGLVDVKVCAVDEIWSGLAFVRRHVDR